MKFAQSVHHAALRGHETPRRLPALRSLAISVAVACAALASGVVEAQSNPGAPETDLAIKAQPADFWTDFWTRETMLGDMGGLRPWLGKYGVSFQLTETSEYLANLRGGLQRGGAYDGVTTATVQVDTSKALGIPGGLFNISALQIHGSNLSTSHLGTLNTASGIETQATTRLWEMWYQQSFLDDRVDVRVGQQSIDQEFLTSQYSALFVNTMFGWPALPSYNMPSGGPAYPLASLGVRARAKITPSLTGLIGVFDGDPLGNDPANLSGTNFNLHNGTMVIGELQYTINQPAEGDLAKTAGRGLPGTYKVGFWYNNSTFADQRFDNTGLSLANPATTGIPARHHGNYSIYAVADQTVWRQGDDGPRSIGVFARVMGGPGDRNLVDFAANAGVVLKAPFAGRDNDSVGLAATYIKVGDHVHDLDLDNRFFLNSPYGVRTQETALEATYQYQVTPWWQLQADAQYTFNAGAGQNPQDPRAPLRNTFVIGMRTNITF
ncbi:MAG: carbohydrate porin [Paraburkholderia sp.]|uniref:carbohydrate porin n=1 Tax=Paraburkholderia sp. TaxID=1926495 RepID=UPI0011FFFF0D|nr:carbohydrate porin [Paraburkholderia sp.]TAM05146.1 MAG: carbohydrate porin [Paraburkholderia sp.]TAM28861.1 MAG: carbohydrate porin [Paraburkholderia sp.]